MLGKPLKDALMIGVALAFGLTAAGASAPADAPVNLPPDPGKAVVTKTCQSCHDLDMVTEARHTAPEWTSVIQRMRANGAELSDDEAKQAQAYLVKVYGKSG